jgi:hypothetical protein
MENRRNHNIKRGYIDADGQTYTVFWPVRRPRARLWEMGDAWDGVAVVLLAHTLESSPEIGLDWIVMAGLLS